MKGKSTGNLFVWEERKGSEGGTENRRVTTENNLDLTMAITCTDEFL
jgi:hypothetical protein